MLLEISWTIEFSPSLVPAKAPASPAGVFFSQRGGYEGQARGRLRVELVEQRLSLLQIGCVEAFGKPAVDRRMQFSPEVQALRLVGARPPAQPTLLAGSPGD